MKRPAKCWVFRGSREGVLYDTLQYVDGSLSCNCPGWTRRVASDGSRSCKHTRYVQMGIADTTAFSCKVLDDSVRLIAIANQSRALASVAEAGARAIVLE